MKKKNVAVFAVLLIAVLLGCPNPVVEKTKSTNSDLSVLSIDSGSLTPTFSAAITEYKVNVENSISSVTVSGVAADENATVSGPITLNSMVEGIAQDISLTVTAEDNKTVKIYKITVERAHAEVSSLSADYGNCRVQLHWNEPTTAAFTGVEITNANIASVHIPKGEKRQAIIGLTNGLEYEFTVKAEYSDGKKSRGKKITCKPDGSAFPNLVENGSFSEGLRAWTKGVSAPGDATISVESGVLCINTITLAESSQLIQARQRSPGFHLKNGSNYRVSFKAWADTTKDISASVYRNGHDIQGDGNIWFPCPDSHNDTYNLTTIPQTFTYDFAMQETNIDAGICFFCGFGLGCVYIDDVSILEL